ncbi:MAG TPA: hypothetical protein DCE23_07010 [Firmicutes bacterium]|nr:hypothetical protein [Bacillota bacterium]
MKKINSFIKKHKYLLFCLLISIIFLSFTSKNSFLYPLNDWVDANAFFTVGKGMMNNVLPYKDIFEQKGPLLYVVYGIGYLLSHKTFHGVFIIEIILFTIFLYYIHKLISLFLDRKVSFIILPILACLLTTSTGFVHGGSCEELCLPLFACSLYYYTKHFKEKELSYKELFINGILAGCILLTKYTLLGFWFAFMMFIFFDLVIKKKYKQSILSCIYFLLGMVSPIVIFLIYFLITNSLKEFIECYFTINISAYNETVSITERLYTIFTNGLASIKNNGYPIFLLFISIPILIFFLKIPKYYKISLLAVIIISMIGIFWGLKFYRYYVFPLHIFIILSIIAICFILRRFIDCLINNKFSLVIYSLIFIISLVCTYFNANYREMIGMKKETMFQYKYADYIGKFENPTLLNMGYLDAGLYTTTGIIPNTKFFEVQNIPYENFPDNRDEMEKNVRNQDVMFILYFTKSGDDVSNKDQYIYDYYDLVKKEYQSCEHDDYTALLFQVKNLTNKS